MEINKDKLHVGLFPSGHITVRLTMPYNKDSDLLISHSVGNFWIDKNDPDGYMFPNTLYSEDNLFTTWEMSKHFVPYGTDEHRRGWCEHKFADVRIMDK